MKFSGWRFCALVSLVNVASVFFVGREPHAQSTTTLAKKDKVIIYPSGNEKIRELKDLGISDVENYGSYWVVSATDAQIDSLHKAFGSGVVEAKYLNRINLGSMILDTTAEEPSIPSRLRQNDTEDKRLRLIQFKGPVKPQWLEQVKGVGNVRVISYVPNNAYVVWMDAQSEQMLQSLVEPMGPVQWIGPYHPYYKIQRSLLTVTSGNSGETVGVRVGTVDDAESRRTADMLQSLGVVKGSYGLTGQKVFGGRVTRSEVAQIAQQSDVLWIQKVEPKRLTDEVQDLIVTSQTNGPGHGPSTITGITNYLSFLTNTVGGGLASFTNQFTYPIVDVADTGFDATFEQYPVPNSSVPGSAFQPSFNEFGIENGTSRLAYQAPGNPGYFVGATIDSGCAALNLNFIGTEDFYNHGTRVASVIAGYDNQASSTDQCIYLTIVTQTLSSVSTCTGTNSQTNAFTFATSPCPVTTNLIITCTSIGQMISTNLDLPTQIIVTQTVDNARRDASGFQFGLGISPFGRIGSSRIWRHNADTIGTPPRVRFVPVLALQPCLEGLFPDLFFEAYSNGGRIQNNSWSEDITITGANGGVYDADSRTYDIAVRDALLVGTSNNVPGPSALNQEFIIVFAANNVLGDAGVLGSVGGFGDIRVTPPATGKNIITVGSSENVRLDGSGCAVPADQDNSFDIWENSQFGPTLDGRFKPEIVAPGTTIYAAKSQLGAFVDPVTGITPTLNDNPCGIPGALNSSTATLTNLYCSPPTNFIAFFPITGTGGGVTYVAPGGGPLYDCRSGSSYAAPAVSGAIQLLWWYFQNRLTNEVGTALLQPSPAMAKAYLCNSARYLPITNPQTHAMDTLPSTAQGMGELDLLRMFDGNTRVIRDESSPRAIDTPLTTTNPAPQQTYFSQSGQTYELSGVVASNGLPFRVTLAWVDAPGTPPVGGLVNDLDLEVTIGGNIYKGNVFSEDHSVPGGSFDSVNNMESVFLPASAVSIGTPYRVVVRAADVAGQGVPNVGSGFNQDFALVVYNSQTNFATLSDVPNLATNNACATAIDIIQLPFSFTNTVSKAIYHNVHPSPSAARGGVDEFFKIDRPTAGTTFTIDTFGSGFDTVLSVWSVQVVPQTIFVRTPCGALTELVSNNDAGSDTQSQLTFTADGSNTYYIVVEPQNDGPGGSMVLNVKVSNSPVTVTPTQLLFGGQIQGTTSSVQTVVYQNTTTPPGVSVQVTDVSISGADPSDFIIASQTCEGNFIAPGTNCRVRVAFTPQSSGFRQANLVITDSATGSPRIVPLSGTGLPPAPLACLSTGALTFTNQAVGTSSAAQTVVLTNCGTAALSLSNVFFTGSGSNDFSVVQNCANSVLAAGGICTNSVTFTSLAAGLRQATLTIQSTNGALTTVSVQGTGFVPAPAVCLSASSLAFGSQGKGTTSAVPLIVTITNCGTTNLSVTAAAIVGANAGDFHITANSCSNVAISGTCSISVNFTPTTGAARTASLAITNNASGSPHLVSLTGSGSVSQPDAAIGKTIKLKKMIGNGVISSTGVGEEFIQKVKRIDFTKLRGTKRGLRFFVTLKNIGTSADQFNVQGDGDSAGFRVKYFLGATDLTDITAGVEAGSFASTTLAPAAVTGDSSLIRIEVFADKAVPKGAVKTFTVAFSSVVDPTKIDVVKATVIAK